MHWIIQENLFNEAEWTQLPATFERFGIPYSIHKVIPFVGELVPEPIPKVEKVICLGSYSMRHTAAKYGWRPGVYDIYDQTFLVQRGEWGERMLNHDSYVIPFKDARLSIDSFMRPIDDSKYFAGRVFTPDEVEDWRHKVVDLGDDYGTRLSGETLVQICQPKIILCEYRYWVVDGKIVTRSGYKRGGRVFYWDAIDSRIDDFVNECISIWQPHDAFVIDVCETPDDLKIVEINTINAAGFYAGNIQSIILSLEEMENEA